MTSLTVSSFEDHLTTVGWHQLESESFVFVHELSHVQGYSERTFAFLQYVLTMFPNSVDFICQTGKFSTHLAYWFRWRSTSSRHCHGQPNFLIWTTLKTAGMWSDKRWISYLVFWSESGIKLPNNKIERLMESMLGHKSSLFFKQILLNQHSLLTYCTKLVTYCKKMNRNLFSLRILLCCHFL